MLSPAGAYLVAEEAKLRASMALKTAMVLATPRLVNPPETNEVLPYVVLGQHQVTEFTDDDGCVCEAVLTTTINFWSRTAPLDKGVQARAMGAAILAALSLDLAVAGWDVVERVVEQETYASDPDGSTHGIIVVRWELTLLV